MKRRLMTGAYEAIFLGLCMFCADYLTWKRTLYSLDMGGFIAQALLLNAGILAVWYCLRRFLLTPLEQILFHLDQVRAALAQEQLPAPRFSLLHITRFTSDMARFSSLALEYYRKHREMTEELNAAQKIIAQFALHQDTLLDSTSREIGTQYRSVLAYANYLEEQIVRNKIDPSLRYDFDEVCESSFNLKLIAGALAMLSVETPPHVTTVPLADIIQRTMLALAPALDRRAMKLTSAEVNLFVDAHGDPGYIAHILWMMMLGMIRYAADESTLRVRCFYSHDESRAMMSIVVSELSSSHLFEGPSNDLAHHLQSSTPHRFAETISVHGNIQLAHLLTERMGGSISVMPLTATSCEICMELPTAQAIARAVV